MGHVAHREMRNMYRILVRKPEWKGQDHLEDVVVNGKIILDWIVGK